jgi:hypothetical protein
MAAARAKLPIRLDLRQASGKGAGDTVEVRPLERP